MKVFNIIILLALLTTSCENSPEVCEKAIAFNKKFETNIILTKIPDLPFDTYILTGKDPVTGRDTVQELPARWFGTFYYFWNIGDTVVKKKESLIIELHKKEEKFDTTRFDNEWRCNGGALINGETQDVWQRRLKSKGIM